MHLTVHVTHIQPLTPHLQEGPLISKERLGLDALTYGGSGAGQATAGLLLLLLCQLQHTCGTSTHTCLSYTLNFC